MTTNKDKSNLDKEIKIFVGLPEIMIGDKKTIKIKGIHLVRPNQMQLNEAKEFALEKNLNKVFIYNCFDVYFGVKGQHYTDYKIKQTLSDIKLQ